MSNKPTAKQPPREDPLAGARVVRETPDDGGVDFTQPDEKPAAPAVQPPPDPPKDLAPPPAPVVVPKYRVLALTRTSINGQPVVLKVGKVISEEQYGPGVIESLRNAKVPLELVVEK